MAAAPVISIAARKGTLYEIIDHLGALLDTLEGAGDPEVIRSIEADIAACLDAQTRKVDAIAGYLAHCEAQQEAAAAEIKRLQERKSLYEKRQERLKAYVVRIMEDLQVRKLEGETSTLMLRACPPSVEILDEEAIPEQYKVTRVAVSVDKKAIKAALEADIDVPGADLVVGRNTVVRR